MAVIPTNKMGTVSYDGGNSKLHIKPPYQRLTDQNGHTVIDVPEDQLQLYEVIQFLIYRIEALEDELVISKRTF